MGLRFGHLARLAAIALALPLCSGAVLPTGTSVAIALEGQRSDRGMLLLCLTPNPRKFPDCTGDPAARRLTIPATDRVAQFEDMTPGDYAVSLIHDENGNGRMDVTLGIPREGYGFSRNAPVRFGPPRFSQAEFPVGGVPVRQTIRVRYLL